MAARYVYPGLSRFEYMSWVLKRPTIKCLRQDPWQVPGALRATTPMMATLGISGLMRQRAMFHQRVRLALYGLVLGAGMRAGACPGPGLAYVSRTAVLKRWCQPADLRRPTQKPWIRKENRRALPAVIDGLGP